MSALGSSGMGHVTTFGDRELVWTPWTQSTMDAFEAWLVHRVLQARMEMAEVMRRKGRKLIQEAKALRDRGLDMILAQAEGENIDPATKVDMQESWEDVAGEGQQLQIEARVSVNEVSDQKAAGYYHFFGQLAREARDQFPGRAKIAHLLLLPKQPTITLAEVEAMLTPGKFWDEIGTAIAEANEDGKKSEKSGDSTPAQKTTTSATTSTGERDAAKESASP